jgi:hypothetical protein
MMRIETQRPAVTFVPFGRPDCRGHFTPTRVWIEDREGRVVEERVDPRTSFAGHVLMTSWDRLHLLYFMATLIGIILPRRFCSHSLVSTSTRLVHMKNTARPSNGCKCSYPLASRLIVLNRPSFNEKGLLQRLDYVAEIAGAVGAHYCFDHTSFSGLVFPTLLRVVSGTLTGPLISGPTGVLLLISDIAVSTNL